MNHFNLNFANRFPTNLTLCTNIMLTLVYILLTMYQIMTSLTMNFTQSYGYITEPLSETTMQTSEYKTQKHLEELKGTPLRDRSNHTKK
jgi:hypothetical protein